MTFRDTLKAAQSQNRSTLALGMIPVLSRLPYEFQRYDDPFLPFGKAIIDSTADLVCAYVFHLGSYLTLGAAGAVALERTMAYVPTNIVKILHGPFANKEYIQAVSETAFAAHAVTLSTFVSASVITAYIQQPSQGVFVKAPTDADLEPLWSLADKYPDQLGLYRNAEAGGILDMLAEPRLEIQWHGESILYVSQSDDFRDAIRKAAMGIRRNPQQHIWAD
jgi:hypothetical protein